MKTIKEINELVQIQLEEKTLVSFLNVLYAFLELPLYFFIEYPQLRSSLIGKLNEFEKYEDGELQEAIGSLKSYVLEAFLDPEFVKNEVEEIDDEHYDFLIR